MSDVQFDEPTYTTRSPQRRDSLPTRLVLKLGLAKDKKQAPMILLVIAVLAVVIMFVVGFGGSVPDDSGYVLPEGQVIPE